LIRFCMTPSASICIQILMYTFGFLICPGKNEEGKSVHLESHVRHEHMNVECDFRRALDGLHRLLGRILWVLSMGNPFTKAAARRTNTIMLARVRDCGDETLLERASARDVSPRHVNTVVSWCSHLHRFNCS